MYVGRCARFNCTPPNRRVRNCESGGELEKGGGGAYSFYPFSPFPFPNLVLHFGFHPVNLQSLCLVILL